MTLKEDLTKEMNLLEVEIKRQQKYINDYGVNNDIGEFDPQWLQYKQDAQYNLDKWDAMNNLRNKL